MQFYHPENLYYLFLLIIPVLIHLFQLQRFKKESFTNVRFLKEIELESRKSSRLKRLLILLTRLLALTCLIMAFAQPYYRENTDLQIRDVIVYINNSMSMQAKGDQGIELFQELKGELLGQLDESDLNFTLISNDGMVSGLNTDLLKQEVLKLNLSPFSKDLSQILMEISTLDGVKPEHGFEVFLFSDFRHSADAVDSLPYRLEDRYHLVQVRQEPMENISLDTVWIETQPSNEIKVKARIKGQDIDVENLSVSLILNDVLYGKSTVDVRPQETSELDFQLPAQSTGQGVMTFLDPRVGFDNSIFFVLPARVKKKVLILGERSSYLEAIYSDKEFETDMSGISDLNQGLIDQYDLIVLNELQKVSAPLIQSLKSFVSTRGNLVIISPADPDLFEYQKILSALEIGTVNGQFETEKLITGVNYDHPFFSEVFKEQVTNFQYPFVKQGLVANLPNGSTLIQFEDGDPFVSEIRSDDNRIYWITSPLSPPLSDFVESPLVVPLFYNFSLKNTGLGSAYHLIGQENEILLEHEPLGEEPITLQHDKEEFIPRQRTSSNQTRISTLEYPVTPGIYELKHQDQVLSRQAFNYDREMIRQRFEQMNELNSRLPNSTIANSAELGISTLNELFSRTGLWQLFITFVMVFLALEMIIQTVLKT